MMASIGPIGQLEADRPVIIHGAGISGLLLGYFLKQQGLDVSIYEKESRAGGKIKTETTEYGPYECAANAILADQDVLELLQQINLPYLSAHSPLKKKVWRFGSARQFPLKWYECLRLLWGLTRKVPKKNVDQLSVGEFFAPLMGEKLAHQVMGAALAGIYSMPPHQLHFQSIFKQAPMQAYRFIQFAKLMIQQRKATPKLHSISFKGGMQTFISALQRELGDSLKLGQTCKISPEENHIICTSAIDAADLLQKGFPEVAAQLRNIEYVKLKSSTFFLDRSIPSLEQSFGVVFPPDEFPPITGVLNNRAIFDHRVNRDQVYSYTVISKGATSDPDLERAFFKFAELSSTHKLLGRHTDWERAIPVYNLSRAEAVLKLRTMLISHPGILLFGNYTGGISIREMLGSSKRFSQKVSPQNRFKFRENSSINSTY